MHLLPAFVGTPTENQVYNVDALTLLGALPDASVDLIATDPPFNIDKASWDSWDTLDAFLAWLDAHLLEFKRVLKPNGSLYLFAATKYQAHVELAVGRHFNVLSNIRWRKDAGWHKKTAKEDLRAYTDASETIIFAEQWAAREAVTFADYELNGSVYAPLKEWFRCRARGAGISNPAFNKTLGFASNGGGVASGVIGSKIEFSMPTAETYQKMQRAYPGVFDREYEDLKREYEDLKREYEDLRRPFFATADAPYTDVWDFRTVNTYPGKHICEKPLDMCEHIILRSSRPDALVLDPFCGSGNMLRAAFVQGRRFIGCDMDSKWAWRAQDRITQPFARPLFAA